MANEVPAVSYKDFVVQTVYDDKISVDVREAIVKLVYDEMEGWRGRFSRTKHAAFLSRLTKDIITQFPGSNGLIYAHTVSEKVGEHLFPEFWSDYQIYTEVLPNGKVNASRTIPETLQQQLFGSGGGRRQAK